MVPILNLKDSVLSVSALDMFWENEKLKGTHRGDEWRIEQFNRNRGIEDQVKTIEEMDKKVEKMFGKSDE